MLKISHHLVNSSLILVRKQLSDGTTAALILMRTPARRYSDKFYGEEKCPPPPPPRKSRKLLWTAIGATVLAGSAIVYAKNSADTRNWLESNVPWANKIVAVVYEENQTHYEFMSNSFYRVYMAINNFMFGVEGVEPMQFKQRSEQDLEKDACIGFEPKTYALPEPILKTLYEEEPVHEPPEVEIEATLVETEECEPVQPKEYKVTKEIVQLEEDMQKLTREAMDEFKVAIKLCEKFNNALFRVVETPYDYMDKGDFVTIKSSRADRDQSIEAARAAYAKASCSLEELDRLIDKGEVNAPPDYLTKTKRFIRQFRDDLTAADRRVKEELEKSNIGTKFWNKVDQARKMYRDELEALYPGVDLCAPKMEIRGDTDLLLCYTIKQVQFLQNELAQVSTIAEQKIARAIECNDAKEIIEAKAEDMVRKERIQMEMANLKKTLLMEAEFQKKFKEQLAKQVEIQEEIMRTRMEKKEKEIMYNVSRAVSEEVEKERLKFKKELAAMAGKLQAIEQTLKQRAAQEQESRRSQSLWAAAEGLLAATRKPEPRTSVENEIKAIEKAGQGDKLVQTVVKGLPKETRESPIATENALRDRFDEVEKTTLKVALIGREGASLPMYFLSWLQSKILFNKMAEIPADELNNKPVDFTKLDTFDIIQRARYYMDRGNLHAALRYVNLLQGAPRAAAKCWADDARRHLEVKQIAETVMAHASLANIKQ